MTTSTVDNKLNRPLISVTSIFLRVAKTEPFVSIIVNCYFLQLNGSYCLGTNLLGAKLLLFYV